VITLTCALCGLLVLSILRQDANTTRQGTAWACVKMALAVAIVLLTMSQVGYACQPFRDSCDSLCSSWYCWVWFVDCW